MAVTLYEDSNNPFSLRLPLDQLYSSPQSEQFFSVLLNSIGGKDFLILVIGEAQSGKTTLLSKLTDEIKENVKPCQLKIRESGDPGSGNNHYPAFLYRTENNQVIILDDAHDLNSQELSIILKNAWDTKKKTNQVILFCDPSINTLISSLLRNMPKKTSVNKLYIPSFDEIQTESYLFHYLDINGLSESFSFSDKSIKYIYEESKGLPGKINRAAEEIFESKAINKPEKKKWFSNLNPVIACSITLLILCVVAGFILLRETKFVPSPDSKTIRSSSVAKKILKDIPDDPAKSADAEPDYKENINNSAGSLNNQPVGTEPAVVEVNENMKTSSKPQENELSETAEKITDSPVLTNSQTVEAEKPVEIKKAASPAPEKKKPKSIKIKTAQKNDQGTKQGVLLKEDWISKQNPDRYTIQILAAKENDAAERFKKLKINTDYTIAYYKMISDGGIWHKFIYGDFETIDETRIAIEKLPAKLKNLGPWPRQFRSIQNDINNFKNNKK